MSLVRRRTLLVGTWWYRGTAATGQELERLTVPEKSWSVALSRDGRHALTGSWDSRVRLYDLAGGTGVGSPP